ncbi:MAG: metallophosphoesterase [Actinomycetota bacterium]|nr:metallophosphoesterase [Actinomycetota bacterium]
MTMRAQHAENTDDAIVTILHLSDFHFEAEKTQQREALRQTANDAMIRMLRELVREGEHERDVGNLVNDWAPHIVAITGDIAYTGSWEDYGLALTFFERLREALGLDREAMVFCPGNHDRNMRNALELNYPESAQQSDAWLSPERLGPIANPRRAPQVATLVSPFLDFVQFCEDAGAMKPTGLPGLDYLTGLCQVTCGGCDVEFIVLNSAWFASPGSRDIRNLWIGLPLLEAMQLGICDERDADPPDGGNAPRHRLRVGLCHHPRDWLHPEEHDSYSLRPNTFSHFAEHCDIILNGHVHGALESPTLAHNSAQTFTGGASYASGRYRNNFSVIQVNLEDNSARRRGFEYDPRQSAWQEMTAAAGTYQVLRRNVVLLPHADAVSLSGSWRSVFWPEYYPSVRKDYENIVLIDGDGEGVFVSDKRPNDSGLHLWGELRSGFFSGSWHDEEREEDDGRYGTFQVKVCAGGNKLLGRWLGFDKSFNIRVGHWQFWRI